MPRLKNNGKKEVRDPIYTQARWGGRKIEPEQHVVVRSGRIKKAKTIFDPSDSPLLAPSPVPVKEPEKKSIPVPASGEKRRLSVCSTTTSQVSTISAKTNISATPSSIVAAPQPNTNTSNVKRRKSEAIPNAKPIPKPQSPASPKTNAPNPQPYSPVIINGRIPLSGSKGYSVSLLKSKQTPQTSTAAASTKHTEPVASASAPPKLHNNSLLAAGPLLKRKVLTYQCCVCNKFDALDSIHWMKCNGCMVNVHKTCTLAYHQMGPWLCRKCTICNECEGELNTEEEACCNNCFSLWHIDCLPANQAPVEGGTSDWACQSCKKVMPTKKRATVAVAGTAAIPVTKEKEKEKTEKKSGKSQEAAVVATTTAAVPTEPQRSSSSSAAKTTTALKYDPINRLPDASKWSSQDVHDFFAERFPKEAGVFLDQEIDGVSLLLMRRSDVIQGLGFKLGPALRIYKQIIMLQTRDTDPTLTWY